MTARKKAMGRVDYEAVVRRWRRTMNAMIRQWDKDGDASYKAGRETQGFNAIAQREALTLARDWFNQYLRDAGRRAKGKKR